MSSIALKQDVVHVAISILQTRKRGAQSFCKAHLTSKQQNKSHLHLAKKRKKKKKVEPVTIMPPFRKMEKAANCFNRKKPELNLFFSELRMICNIWQ